jgi:galactose mutarotase-like enzyme
MEIFGTLADGGVVERHRLQGADGLAVDILTLGGIVQRVFAPDRDGRLADVVLGFDRLDAYLADGFYLGALIGRCANRIGNGRVVIDGTTYLLSRNNGLQTLHGGASGFNRALWTSSRRPENGCICRSKAPMATRAFPARCGSMRPIVWVRTMSFGWTWRRRPAGRPWST